MLHTRTMLHMYIYFLSKAEHEQIHVCSGWNYVDGHSSSWMHHLLSAIHTTFVQRYLEINFAVYILKHMHTHYDSFNANHSVAFVLMILSYPTHILKLTTSVIVWKIIGALADSKIVSEQWLILYIYVQIYVVVFLELRSKMVIQFLYYRPMGPNALKMCPFLYKCE